jgi:hypothetical protein
VDQFVTRQVVFMTENFVTLVTLEQIWLLMDLRVSFELYFRRKCLETIATFEPVRVVFQLVMLV